jgi:hypothetical protein
MEDLRSILLDLQSKLKEMVDRIPLGEAPSPMTFSSISDPGESENVTRGQPQSPSPQALKLPGGGPNGCSEQYHSKVLIAFHKWARVILLLFIDKVISVLLPLHSVFSIHYRMLTKIFSKAFCVAYQPFLKNAKSKIWPSARKGYAYIPT